MDVLYLLYVIENRHELVLPQPFWHVHAALAVLPAGELAPLPHAVHALAPVPDHVPAAHAAQALDSLFANLPAGHAAHALAPAAETVPTPHVPHDPLPITALNVPAAHAAHVSQYESAPVHPAAHVFSATHVTLAVLHVP